VVYIKDEICLKVKHGKDWFCSCERCRTKMLELKGRDRDKLICLKKSMQADVHRWWHPSTDRDHAWELWDELPAFKKHLEHINGIHEIVFQDNTILEFIYCQGNSFGDAVSTAWLRWFYNTQWLKK